MGIWFDWVRIAGAAYLAWLGFRLIRSPGALGDPQQTPRPRIGFFWQGFLVLMSNPKALLVFGAFIPQFVDAKGDYVPQVILLGVTAMVVAGTFDSIYAILAGRARHVISAARVRMMSRVSGGLLIGGGIWLALLKKA
jgi:threonine/homoserine/homoserine lactone efflux protein